MTRDFFKGGFTADDFDGVDVNLSQRIADRANAILKAELEKAVEVYAMSGNVWLAWRDEQDLRKARLVRVEEMKR